MGIIEFRQYCEVWKNHPTYQDLQQSNHDAFAEQFCRDPGLLNIRDVEYTYKEVRMQDDKRTISQPDIIFINAKDSVYVVECKGVARTGRGASKSLRATFNFVNTRFGISPELIAVRPSRNRDEAFHIKRISPI